ncbi:PREDICTED: probably inactive leucine-rich repeat receptor-like protein kinase At2g25790 [Prunus mume]|uniref:non-specific serine/threonine protein kinase n=1 Tax=Prunus mume TaxID=102107 RepID=A0ABM0N644_PRUMU|nr:PREDICTED: probably inactive leucine-rich repeat receptor-like protein kinase At2g25790 [Prunus mume]
MCAFYVDAISFELMMMMKMARRRPHQTCLISCMFMFLFFFSNQTSALDDGDEHQLQLLLSFKASINDPLNFLSDWNKTTSSNNPCNWHGITCDNNTTIKTVELSGRNISGKLSSSIFHLPHIETIDLSNNQLAGQLPKDMFAGVSNSLRHLNLSNNNFTGVVPQGSVASLEVLDLSNNMISGQIPDGIGSFSSLKFLDLGGNVLLGSIPSSISNMSSLEDLTLASNQLSGKIPTQLGQLKSLKWIYLGYNNLSGQIPEEIGNLVQLNHLDLVFNKLTGQIPVSLSNLTQLRYLFLYGNKLTGPVPQSLFGLENLVSLDLSDNFLSGEISENVDQLQNLEILHLFSNNFTGKIPSSLASLPRLQVLQLWSNKFSGEIPRRLGYRNNITVLDLSTNSLTGKIPDTLCDSGRLFKLILFSNSLEGEIPRSFSSCKSLGRVRLQNNRLSGEISAEFTKLPLVYFLDISGNNLSGRIGERKWDMPSLQMLNIGRNGFFGNLPDNFGSEKLENLDLSENRFSGTISPSFGNLSELMQLKLSHNELSGPIPQQLSSCMKLVSLDLSHNRLTGTIPTSLSDMPVLGDLDLSENDISGEIPRNLGVIESLVQVNISHNKLHGTLPYTPAFLAINPSAVAGNDLCGSDTTTSGLPPCKSVKRNPTWWFVVTCSLVALLGFGVATYVFVIIQRRNDLKVKTVESEGGIWELQFFDSKVSRSVTIHDIFSAAKQGNVIAMGKTGISYRGESVLNGMQFVVKEDTMNSIPPSFRCKMVEFGRLRHPNVIKLIGICHSQKGAYVLYEYCEGKVLSQVLRDLSWEQRRKIALGIARALRFLHCRCSPSVVAGRVSPEKVIVDAKDEPRIRLSLPGMVQPDSKGFIASSYIAPEAKEGKGITEKSDIYGFGLVLIELLTGKGPADTEFGAHESIVEWARYCYSDCHLDVWTDPMIRGHVSSNQNEIVETMNLALHCTAGDPTARPCADELYKTLDSIIRTSSCVSSLKVSSPF